MVAPFSRSGIFNISPNNRGNVSVQCERSDDGKGKTSCVALFIRYCFPSTLLFFQHTLREKCPYSQLFWSVFSHIRIKHGEILRISPYSVRMRENTDQNNSEYGHFLRSDTCGKFTLKSLPVINLQLLFKGLFRTF